MSLAGKLVLVTGGTGFIGGRLVEKLVLQQQARVRVLVRDFKRAARIARFPLDMVGGSITDGEVVRRAARGCDVVFHCAYDFAGTRPQQRQVALEGTRNVGEAVVQHAVARMVHVSTFAVYAPTPDSDLLESSPWPRTTNAYVEIKRQAERLVLDLCRRQRLPVVIVQPTLVYGPFSPHWTLAIVDRLKTGVVPLLNGGTGYCNAVYVDDVVDAMILAAIRPDVVGERFLISGEKPITWREFYGGFEAALDIRATTKVSEREIATLARRRRVWRDTLGQLRNLVRQPEVRTQLLDLPLAQRLAEILRKHLSEGQWLSLRARVFGDAPAPVAADGGPARRLHLPDESLLALYRSQTRVRIDKAKERLGYAPRFDFARGMDLTARFIHWANLGVGVASHSSALS